MSAEIELTWSGKHQLARAASGGSDDRRLDASTLPIHQMHGVSAGGLLVRGEASVVLDTIATEVGPLGLVRGQVKACYVDPPFNTGARFRHFADNMSAETWLSMLRERLQQIKRLLTWDGSVWVHLDDSQQHRARCVLDEVFGADAFVATIIWQKRATRENRTAFSSMHDYIHVYAPVGPRIWKRVRNALPDTGAYGNPDSDPAGPWRSIPMTAQAGHGTPQQHYTVLSPAGTSHLPPQGRCWTYTRERFTELCEAGRVYWPRQGRGKPRLKHYQHEARGLAPFTIWTASEVGDTSTAKKHLIAEFPDVAPFDTPKPERLLERIVAVATDPGEIVLDCFLGSGTTAVAAHRIGRRWIGVEESEPTLRDFAIPRLIKEVARTGGDVGFAYTDIDRVLGNSAAR